MVFIVSPLPCLCLRHGVSGEPLVSVLGAKSDHCPALPRARMRAWDGPVAASES